MNADSDVPPPPSANLLPGLRPVPPFDALPASPQTPERLPESDKRLDRLFEHTRFHLSLCLSVVGALVSLIAGAGKSEVIKDVIGSPRALAAATIMMLIAAIAGGVILSSSVRCRSFAEFWNQTQGPYSLPWFSGRTWAAIEHTAFWFSVVLIAISILSKREVVHWLAT